MRKFSKLVVLCLTLVMALFLASCKEKIELSFENETMTMIVGDTKTLVPVANKEGLTYEWTSDKTAVVTVDAGLVTAVSAGTAKVTVKVKDKDVSATITITVNPVVVSFTEKTMTIAIDQSVTLTPTVVPAQTMTYTWTTSDASVATVTNGVVKGIKVGTATVTASGKGGSASITINVVLPNPTQVTITGASASAKVGATMQLGATILPAKASQAVTWKSSDTKLATVSASGLVTFVGVGKVTITATSVALDSQKASVTIDVGAPDPTKVAITGANSFAKVGETMDLKATVLPSKASQEVTWSVSDEALATVSKTGLVTFLGIGKVSITATSVALASQKATVSVNIIEPDPVSITVSGADGKTELQLAKTLQMTAVVKPDLADQSVTWSTSDMSIAFIDETGLLTAVKVGTVDVIATSQALGSLSGTITINVILPLPEEINATIPETVLQIEETMQLSATITPALANQQVTYQTSNEAVATVSTSGLVTGVAAGTATITITSQELSSLVKTFEVKIINKLPAPSSSDVVVDSALKTVERYSQVVYENVDYIVGINAFADFGKIVTQEKMAIFVQAGTYTEDLMITSSKVTILGPNSDKDPNKDARVAAAIISGKITIEASLEYIMINGFDFTGNGAVYGNGPAKNISFIYNKVYDTAENTVAWSGLRNYNLVGFFTFWKQGKVMEDFVITNNAFSNVPQINIMMGNLLNLTIKDNTFKDFAQDAIRLDGGYNSGLLLVDNNLFANTTLSGYNGLYLRSLGAARNSANPQVVKVTNNHFKNIGQAGTDFSGALSTNSYQEYGLNITISHNVFETCTNYLWVRNNATADNHANYPWVGKVEYNAFLGEPLVYYHHNRNATDTEITNPALIEFAYNFFGDASGKVISLDMNKFLAVKSVTNNFNSLEELNAAS